MPDLSPEHERLIETVRVALAHAQLDDPWGGDVEAHRQRLFAASSALDALALKLARLEKLEDSAEMAWVIIANAGEGNWETQTEDWQAAAVRWREQYHALLAAREEETA